MNYEQLMLPNFFAPLLEYNIPIEIKIDKNGEIFFRIEGFAKSGYADLHIVNNGMECRTRYNTVHVIDNLEDLVKVNAIWGAISHIRNSEDIKTQDELNKMSILELLNFSQDNMDKDWFNLFNNEERNLINWSSQEDSCLSYPRQILDPVIEKDVEVNLIVKDGKWGYRIHDFYKSGHVDFFLKNGNFYAHQRYEMEDRIESLSDLIYLNIKWAEITQQRNLNKYKDFTDVMSPNWKNLAIDENIIEAMEITKTIYNL